MKQAQNNLPHPNIPVYIMLLLLFGGILDLTALGYLSIIKLILITQLKDNIYYQDTANAYVHYIILDLNTGKSP